jgi:hypothetical protein
VKRFYGTNGAILILGLVAAALINYLVSLHFASSYDHLTIAREAEEVAVSDLQLENEVRQNIATVDRMIAAVSPDQRVSAIVSEVRYSGQQSRVSVASLQANGTPTFTLAGDLAGILGFCDSMRAWPVPLRITSLSLSGEGSHLVAQVNATL